METATVEGGISLNSKAYRKAGSWVMMELILATVYERCRGESILTLVERLSEGYEGLIARIITMPLSKGRYGVVGKLSGAKERQAALRWCDVTTEPGE